MNNTDRRENFKINEKELESVNGGFSPPKPYTDQRTIRCLHCNRDHIYEKGEWKDHVPIDTIRGPVMATEYNCKFRKFLGKLFYIDANGKYYDEIFRQRNI